MIRSDSDQRESSQNFCDTKLQNFLPNFFNFKIIFALSILENIVASKFSTFTFFCDIPQHDPSGDIKRPADGVEDITVARTVSLWDYGSNGYLCVHPSAGINVPPGSSASNIINTIQNTIGVLVLITVCLSDHLV